MADLEERLTPTSVGVWGGLGMAEDHMQSMGNLEQFSTSLTQVSSSFWVHRPKYVNMSSVVLQNN